MRHTRQLIYTGNGVTASVPNTILPCDPIPLEERLDILMASGATGNTGIRNELVSVGDELLRQTLIDRSRYRNGILLLHISIIPVFSKIFDHCTLDRFSSFLATKDDQFGIKKGLSCSHAIYSIKSVIHEYFAGVPTVNICAIDLSKAFDRMNHFALFSKLMNRNR